jgi:hypothetical protein
MLPLTRQVGSERRAQENVVVPEDVLDRLEELRPVAVFLDDLVAERHAALDENVQDFLGRLDERQREGTCRRSTETNEVGPDGLVFEQEFGFSRCEETVEPP